MAVPAVYLEIFVRIVRVECMLERLSELPVGEGRYEIDLRKKIPLAVRTFQSVIDGSLFYTQRSSIDDFVSEIDIGRKAEIPQIDIGIEIARQVTAAEFAHGVDRRIVVFYIARQTKRPVERVRGRQYRPIVVDVPAVGERLDEIGILCIIVVDHRIMLQLVLEDGRKPRFLYLAGMYLFLHGASRDKEMIILFLQMYRIFRIKTLFFPLPPLSDGRPSISNEQCSIRLSKTNH